MRHHEIHRDVRVAVANLGHIPKNYGSLDDAPASLAHAPHVFKAELFDNRQGRIGQLGTARRFYTGHAGVVWVVEHDDQSLAVYHYLELVRPGDLAAALSTGNDDTDAGETGDRARGQEGSLTGAPSGEADDSPGSTEGAFSVIDEPRTLFSGMVRGTMVEAYVGLEPTELEADVLIAPLVSDQSPAEQLEMPIHHAIHEAAGNWFHSRLAALGDSFGPCATKHIEGPAGKDAVAFKSVVFINGVEPQAEAIAAALQAAHDAQAKTVILSVPAFMPGFTGALNVGKVLRGIISIVSTMADIRGTDFAAVKIVF